MCKVGVYFCPGEKDGLICPNYIRALIDGERCAYSQTNGHTIHLVVRESSYCGQHHAEGGNGDPAHYRVRMRKEIPILLREMGCERFFNNRNTRVNLVDALSTENMENLVDLIDAKRKAGFKELSLKIEDDGTKHPAAQDSCVKSVQ